MSVNRFLFTQKGSTDNTTLTQLIDSINALSTPLGTMSGVNSPAPVINGGTGSATASGARTNLGLAIGSDVQAHSAVLDSTTASYTSADDTKLSGIAAGADVTATAIKSATSASIATGDKLVFLDVSNSNVMSEDTVTNLLALANSGGGDFGVCDGRLTLTSGNPVSAPGTNSFTLYWTPYKGNSIGLYDGVSAWTILQFSQITITATGSDQVWDIFAYNNSGSVAIHQVQWTNGNTRATALTPVNGVYCLSGATQYRYLGTIWPDDGGTGVSYDPQKTIGLWNYYNRLPVSVIGDLSSTVGSSWTINATTGVRVVNNSGSYGPILNAVSGIVDHVYNVNYNGLSITSPTFTGSYNLGIGVSSVSSITDAVGGHTSTNSFNNNASPYPLSSMATVTPTIGRNYICLLETCVVSSGSVAVVADDGHGGKAYFNLQTWY